VHATLDKCLVKFENRGVKKLGFTFIENLFCSIIFYSKVKVIKINAFKNSNSAFIVLSGNKNKREK
jgi:hypothetical protein